MLRAPLAIACLAACAAAAPPEAFPARLDRMLAAGHVGPLPPRCSDEDFLRRASLDLTGVIPTADALRAFAAEPASDKRAKLVDRLLADPRHPRWLATWLDLSWMERRNKKHVDPAEWQAWLLAACRRNEPLDAVLRAMLVADGAEGGERGPARFVLDREAEAHLVTRDAARTLFGRDVQCAQCHDHPNIEDYRQSEYYGLHAFFARTSVFVDAKKKSAALAEKAEGDEQFESVFKRGRRNAARPTLPGAAPLAEAPPPPGKQYKVAPAKDVRPVPAASRRALLAEALAGNRQFRRNVANRAWAFLFGRGLVHPVDLHCAENPAAAPDVLDALADEFAARKFNLRSLLADLAKTDAYQRSSELPADLSAHAAAAGKLRPEALTARKAAEARVAAALAQRKALRVQLGRGEDATAGMVAAAAAAGEKIAAAKKALDGALVRQQDAERDADRTDAVARAFAEAAASAKKAAAFERGNQDLQKAAGLFESKSFAALAEAKKNSDRLSRRRAEREAAEPKLAKAQAEAKPADEKLAKAEQPLAATRIALRAAEDDLFAARAGLKLAERRVAELELVAAAVKQEKGARDALAERWSERFALAGVKPLAPEQLAWSVLQATGQLAALEQQARAELMKPKPAPAAKGVVAAKANPKAPAAKPVPAAQLPPPTPEALEAAVFEKAKGTLGQFAGVYGGAAAAPQFDFFATPDQALFAANSGVFDQWLHAGGGMLLARAAAAKTDAAAAAELCLAIVGRQPAPEEAAELAAALAKRPKDRTIVLKSFAWALLASAEFRFSR